MNRLGSRLSAGTQQLAHQAVTVAQAAGASIVAGLRTCDERGDGLGSDIIIRPDGRIKSDSHGIRDSGGGGIRTDPLPVPSTALGLPVQHPSVSPEGTVYGSANFQFSLTLVDGGPSGGRIVASAKTHHGKPIAIGCRWKRKIAGQSIAVPEVSNTVYPLSANDIAATVMIEATSLDLNCKGTAYGEIGPFDLNLAARRILDGYLDLNLASFAVRRLGPSEADADLKLEVRSTGIELAQSGGDVKVWPLGSRYPIIHLDYKHDTFFQLQTSESEVLNLDAMGREQRDLLTLAVRCFCGLKWISTDTLVKLTGIAAGRHLPTAEAADLANSVDLLAIVQRLTAELAHCTEKQEKCMRERDRARIEKDALEQDMAETIGAYKQLLSQTSTTEKDYKDLTKEVLDISQRAAHVANLETKLREAQIQSEKYIEELECLRKDYRNLQQKSQTSGIGENVPKDSLFMTSSRLMDTFRTRTNFNNQNVDLTDSLQTGVLRKQLDDLQRAYDNLLESTQQASTVRTMEPAEATETESQTLMAKKIEDLQEENKGLVDNFIYIKQKYDDLVKERTRHSGRASQDNELAEVERSRQQLKAQLEGLEAELSATREQLASAISEKNRLQKKYEAVCRDLEKSRAQLQTKTEALLGATRQLADERSTVEQKLHQVEASLVDQQAVASSLEESRNSEQLLIQSLERQLEERDREIERLKVEADRLRSRIRKLASE